jgi:hypothetical protein
MPAHGPRGEARELAGQNRELAGQKMSAPKAASVTGPGEDGRAPGGASPRRARPLSAAPPQATQVGDPAARPHRSGAQRDGQQAPARAATPGEQIVSYYDHADQPIADYLAALGWTQPPHRPSGSTRGSGFRGAPRRHGQLGNTRPGN